MTISRRYVPSLQRDLSRLMGNPSSAQPDSHEAGLELYFKLGGNCLYLHGEGDETHSREATGRWLRDRARTECFLSTQICHDQWHETNAKPINRFTALAVAEDISRDLELLGVDHIELVALGDNPAAPLEPVIERIACEIKAGRVSAYGLNSWCADRVQQAATFARQRGLPQPAAVLTTELALPYSASPLWPEYPPFTIELQQAVLSNSLAIFAHVEDFNLGQCLFEDAETMVAGRRNWSARWKHPANDSLVARVKEFAAKRRLTPREVNLSYVLNQPFPVVGIVNLFSLLNDQHGEYERATAVQLSVNELEELTAGLPR